MKADEADEEINADEAPLHQQTHGHCIYNEDPTSSISGKYNNSGIGSRAERPPGYTAGNTRRTGSADSK